VIKFLRGSEIDAPVSSRLPVIALTALAAKCDRERCMEAGMDEYLSKPFRVRELYAAIDRGLGSVPSGCLTSDVQFTSANPSSF
jgi:CheY-like chemotaxis protein